MKVDINVPESLNEITLQQFQKYIKLITDNEPSEFVNQKTIEIFCNIKISDVAKISFQSYNEILEHLNSLFNVNHKLIPIFQINGLEFGFEPNLENIKTGAYIDAETYLQNPDTLHKAMAVLYRPIKSKRKNLYTTEDYEGADVFADVMKYAPLDVVLGMQVFFYNLLNELQSVSIRYIQEKMMELSEVEKKHLEENGVGINQFTQQLKEIYYDSIQLPNLNLLSS
jgi:uncharacterized protein YqfB (UPF0267 family)